MGFSTFERQAPSRKDLRRLKATSNTSFERNPYYGGLNEKTRLYDENRLWSAIVHLAYNKKRNHGRIVLLATPALMLNLEP